MRELNGKRYWIVGASAGLGRDVAKLVSKTGATVVVSARNKDELETLAEECGGRVVIAPCDVSDAASVAAAAEIAGDVDGMVFAAGVYWPMKAQEFDGERAAQMLDINLTGAARVLGHVLPSMVEKDAGHIVLVGSLSGFRGLPGAAGYGASKAGLMSLGETLYADLRNTGVDVQLVNPGFIKTRLTDKNEFSMPFIMESEAAAREVIEHMQDDGFAKNFPRLFASMFRLSQFLPDWIYYRTVGKA